MPLRPPFDRLETTKPWQYPSFSIIWIVGSILCYTGKSQGAFVKLKKAYLPFWNVSFASKNKWICNGFLLFTQCCETFSGVRSLVWVDYTQRVICLIHPLSFFQFCWPISSLFLLLWSFFGLEWAWNKQFNARNIQMPLELNKWPSHR